MAQLGRNFDFRIPPKAEARAGRFIAPTTAAAGTQSAGGGTFAYSNGYLTFPGGLVPIGAPVTVGVGATPDAYGRLTVAFPSAGAAPTAGINGIAVFNYGPAAFAGYDPVRTVYSDLGFIPLGAPIIVVAGDPATKVAFTNVPSSTFLGNSASGVANSPGAGLTGQGYPGRIMVNGLGATTTVEVGAYLVPGNCNDTDGYWESQSSATGAWLQITNVDSTRLIVEARMLF